MKITKICSLLVALVCTCLFGLEAVAQVAPSTTAPTVPMVSTTATAEFTVDITTVDTTATAFNDANPMPNRLEWLESEEDAKAFFLRSVTRGRISISGAIVSTDGNSLDWNVWGGTPQMMVDGMSRHVFNFAFAGKPVPINVSASLLDDKGTERFYVYKQVMPVLGLDGEYTIRTDLKLTMADYQFVTLPKGITSVNISNVDEFGNVINSYNLYPYQYGEGTGVNIPVKSFLNRQGTLLINRMEPTDSGAYRGVAYAYEIGTGLSKTANMVTGKQSVSIENYVEVDDMGVPLFVDGDLVPINIDLRVRQNLAEQDGVIEPQDQPTARVEVSMVRVQFIWTGLVDTSNSDGTVIEKGRIIKIKNVGTGVVMHLPVFEFRPFTGISLSPGSYDITIHYDALEEPSWYGGKG